VHSLDLAKSQKGRLDVLCIGAHCDDIEIGCGGTVLALQRRYPGCRVHWLILTSVPARRSEALAAARAFVKPACRGETLVCDFPDGMLPGHLVQVKERFEAFKALVDPELILTHHGLDRHQDHSLVSQVTWQTFREHMIWEYEIPKYDGDLVTPNMYVPVSATAAARKIRLIVKAFESQRGKSWFTAENLLAMMRLRGLECRSPSGFAEGFHCRKLVFDALGAAAGEKASLTAAPQTSDDAVD
jgi:LmbE family N-acetylglucosaminyl deacetylase